MGACARYPGFENVDVNWQEATPEAAVEGGPRTRRCSWASRFSDIANTLNTATNGDIASYYQEKGFQYPIIVQLPESERKTVRRLKNLVIRPTEQPGSRNCSDPRTCCCSRSRSPICRRAERDHRRTGSATSR